MKKFIKNNLKVVVAVLVTAIIFTGVGAYAANIQASRVAYEPEDEDWEVSDVNSALNYLYSKVGTRPARQVATLTTQGATYTMQNDGYIVGYVHPSYMTGGGLVYLNEELVFHAVYDEDVDKKVSIYASKGSVVKTREGYGTYSLTVYEFTDEVVE